jgi:hypothetical protein
MNTKDIYHILPLSPFPYALPLILVPSPRKDLFYLPIFHFLKKNLVYITSSSEFHFGIADMYISCFKQISTPIIYFLPHPAPLLFISLQSIMLYYLQI